MRRYSRISGTGSYLPPRRLTNADMVGLLAERGIETSDDWIVDRTGIRARHYADDGVNASDLGLQASLQAIGAIVARWQWVNELACRAELQYRCVAPKWTVLPCN